MHGAWVLSSRKAKHIRLLLENVQEKIWRRSGEGKYEQSIWNCIALEIGLPERFGAISDRFGNGVSYQDEVSHHVGLSYHDVRCHIELGCHIVIGFHIVMTPDLRNSL